MAYLIEKANLTNEIPKANTPDYDPAEYFVISDSANAETKWNTYTILPTSVLSITPKYRKLDNDNIVEMSQAEKDAYDSTIIEGIKTSKKAEVKSEAYRRITTLVSEGGVSLNLPEWKQRNLTTRGLELTEKMAGGGSLTGEEQTELDALKVIWSDVKALRLVSDDIENDIDNCTTVIAVENIEIINNSKWSY